MLLISRLQHHPSIPMVLFLTSLPFSYSQHQEEAIGGLRPVISDITFPPPPDITNPGGPDDEDPVVGDPDFIKDLEKIFQLTPTCHTYSMSHLDKNYDTAQVGSTILNWGMHALQWKGYNHIADNPGGSGTFDADLANTSGPPGGPDHGPEYTLSIDADHLDELELAIYGIFKTDGLATDPTGGWNSLIDTNPLSGAILAAMNMFYWNTPTYVSLLNNNDIGVVVMKEVTLCADGPDPPHVACNWEDNSGAVIGSCETTTLALESIICGFFPSVEPDSADDIDYYYEDDTFFDANHIYRWGRYYIDNYSPGAGFFSARDDI